MRIDKESYNCFAKGREVEDMFFIITRPEYCHASEPWVVVEMAKEKKILKSCLPMYDDSTTRIISGSTLEASILI